MEKALGAAASGMLAQQQRIDVIANNIANVNTPGFKGSRTTFRDLLYGSPPPSAAAADNVQVGSGTGVAALEPEHSQGVLRETGVATDLAIEGDGFFRVRRADGTLAYTRGGSFQVDGNGRLTTASGAILDASFTVPEGATGLTVTPAGRVSATTAGGETVELGTIQLASFRNDGGLAAAGDGLFLETGASGPATATTDGKLRQGFLEASNVSLADEMTSMIDAQRTFGLLSRVIQMADAMNGIANSIKR